MLTIGRNYKLIEMEGAIKEIDTSEAWNVFECSSPNGLIKVNEGDTIEFTIEDDAVVKSGVVTKMSGKGNKTKIQIKPIGTHCEEIWEVSSILDNSLRVVSNDGKEEVKY